MWSNVICRFYFNPRSYKRSDHYHRIHNRPIHHFNPRSYKRSDYFLMSFTTCSSNFNPRSYKRSDDSIYGIHSVAFISIHAPTRGATSEQRNIMSAPRFQSTLLQEERPNCNLTSSPPALFQSTLLQEERQDISKGVSVRNDFNPRSYKRSDYHNRKDTRGNRNFNPRSYKRSDIKISKLHKCI